MAYIPQFVKLQGMSTTINAIATDLGIDTKMVAENDLASLKKIGAYVCGSTAMSNAFCDQLINRVAKVIYSGRVYNNSLALFKKGILEYGEFVEDVFVGLAKGYARVENTADLYQTNGSPAEIPDVKTAFYMSNVRCNYTVSIRKPDLDKAFTTLSGVTELIERIVNSLVKAQSYDEYLLTKVKLAHIAGNGKNSEQGSEKATDGTGENLARVAREVALLAPFMATNNIAGVENTLDPDDLCFVVRADIAAKMDVEVLASAFNMDKADFLGRRVIIDKFDFTDAEKARLMSITGAVDFTDLVPATVAENANTAKCIICSKDLLQIYDTKAPYFTEDYNGLDDVRSYHLHVDQAFAISPFENYTVLQQM